MLVAVSAVQGATPRTRRYADTPIRPYVPLCLTLDPVCSGMKVLLFDTFGTLVHWRTSLISTLTDFGRKNVRQLPAADITRRWHAADEPLMNEVRHGKVPC